MFVQCMVRVSKGELTSIKSKLFYKLKQMAAGTTFGVNLHLALQCVDTRYIMHTCNRPKNASFTFLARENSQNQ